MEDEVVDKQKEEEEINNMTKAKLEECRKNAGATDGRAVHGSGG